MNASCRSELRLPVLRVSVDNPDLTYPLKAHLCRNFESYVYRIINIFWI